MKKGIVRQVSRKGKIIGIVGRRTDGYYELTLWHNSMVGFQLFAYSTKKKLNNIMKRNKWICNKC